MSNKRTVYMPFPEDWYVQGQANCVALLKQHWRVVRGMPTRELRHVIDHIQLTEIFGAYLDWATTHLERMPHISARRVDGKWHAAFVCQTAEEATKLQRHMKKSEGVQHE